MNKKASRKLKQKLLKKVDRRVAGFHIYRSVNEHLPFALWERITDAPIPDGRFDDPAAELGDRYFYRLTEVGADGRESAPFEPKVTYTDHAGNRYPQNPLRDFAGYNIYRSADPSKPLEDWERRNSAPLQSAEFRDDGVVSGEIFYYYVRAVDSEGAESAPGEIMRVVRK